MGSGKYGALSGVMARMQMAENINANLANINTSGYKKGTPIFEARLAEAQATRGQRPTNFVQVSGETIDFTPGPLNRTGDPMNLAISGAGFFRVQQADGELVYARRGNFQINELNEMVTSSGGKLLGEGDAPVVLPQGEIEVLRDGSILSDQQRVGLIPLYLFADTRVLKRGNDGVFIAPDNEVPTLDPRAEMAQGFLEGSNVNVMEETARMISNKRAFEAAQKVLTSYSEMDSKLADLGGLQ
jgi:flagellar basal body rod protein FlgG